MKIYEYKRMVWTIARNLNKRSPEGQLEVERVTADIIRNVKERKDEALIEYSRKFDRVELLIP